MYSTNNDKGWIVLTVSILVVVLTLMIFSGLAFMKVKRHKRVPIILEEEIQFYEILGEENSEG